MKTGSHLKNGHRSDQTPQQAAEHAERDGDLLSSVPSDLTDHVCEGLHAGDVSDVPVRPSSAASTMRFMQRVVWWQRFYFGGERVAQQMADSLERNLFYRRGFLWSPVLFGLGIMVYVSLPAEPLFPALLGVLCLSVYVSWRVRHSIVLMRGLVALSLVLAGMVLMQWQVMRVGTPFLKAERWTGYVAGWVMQTEPRGKGRRLLVAVAAMQGVPGADEPRHIRVYARGADRFRVGDAIRFRARLRPPSGPVMPNGFDFRRHAFFQDIGANGFVLGKVEAARFLNVSRPARLSVQRSLAAVRSAIVTRIRAAVPDREAGLIAALLVGERASIAKADEDALRKAGLAHILAISGLHMALVAMTLYLVIRHGLALFPRLALGYALHKGAAFGALVIGGFYLALSGFAIATERAYLMLALLLLGLLVERPHMAMRGVAFAALILLVFTPASLLSAGFQMSFAAVIALISVYQLPFVKRVFGQGDGGQSGRTASLWGLVGRFFAGIVLTAFIAGLATALPAMFHFQRLAPLGVLGNFLAMPVFSLVVMPAGLLGLLLMPFGLESLGFSLMAHGLEWILVAARWVASFSLADQLAPAMTRLAYVSFMMGGLWLCLWQGVLRVWAFLFFLVPVLTGGVFSPRPDVLIAADGKTLALRGPDGRLRVLGEKSGRFEVAQWYRGDGAAYLPSAKRNKLPARCDRRGCVVSSPRLQIVQSLRPEGVAVDCVTAALIILTHDSAEECAAKHVDGAGNLVFGSHLREGEGKAAVLERKHEGKTPEVLQRWVLTRDALARSGGLSGYWQANGDLRLVQHHPTAVRPWHGRSAIRP